jgi:hypothetical protein
LDGIEELVVALGELGLDLEEEDGHARGDGEEAEVNGEIVVGRGMEGTGDLDVALGEPPEEELIDPDGEVIAEAAEHELREAEEGTEELEAAALTRTELAEDAPGEERKEQEVPEQESEHGSRGAVAHGEVIGADDTEPVADSEGEHDAVVFPQGAEVGAGDEDAGNVNEQGDG